MILLVRCIFYEKGKKWKEEEKVVFVYCLFCLFKLEGGPHRKVSVFLGRRGGGCLSCRVNCCGRRFEGEAKKAAAGKLGLWFNEE